MGITDPSQEYFKDGVWGHNGTAWVKSGVPLAYHDRWVEDLSGVKAGAGTYIQWTTAVPAGYVYVLQGLYLSNWTGVRGLTAIGLYDGTTYIWFNSAATQARYVPLTVAGNFVLKEGDQAVVNMLSCLNLDDMHAGAWGYKLKVT